MKAKCQRMRRKAGFSLLKRYLFLKRAAPLEEQFSAAWKFATRYSWFFRNGPTKKDRRWIDWKDLTLTRILGVIAKHDTSGRPIRPNLTVEGEQVLIESLQLDPVPPTVITIQTGVTAGVIRLLDELGARTSLVINGSGRKNRRRARQLGCLNPLDLIPRTDGCLLRARRKLREGRVVCSCADYAVVSSVTGHDERYIAPGFFELALKTRSRIIYAISEVSQGGEVAVHIAAPEISGPDLSGQEFAHDFIRFIAYASSGREKLNVQTWPARKTRSGPTTGSRSYTLATHLQTG